MDLNLINSLSKDSHFTVILIEKLEIVPVPISNGLDKLETEIQVWLSRQMIKSKVTLCSQIWRSCLTIDYKTLFMALRNKYVKV